MAELILLFFAWFLCLFPCFTLAIPLELGTIPRDDAQPKIVVAHFMVGNTYLYTINDWSNQISLAASKSIDTFALNLGRDPWQPDRVADAFKAAQSSDSSFKLFFSFDMSSFPCASSEDAGAIQKFINDYHSHPNHLLYGDKPLVSTFAGESCRFGTGSLNEGWTHAMKNGLPPIHFVPFFSVDPASFGGLSVMDGAFAWNSGWPAGNNDINFDADSSYISNLGGRTYMAGVSPWFFTHYGPDTYNKNWIYRADDWLFAERWELLAQHRDSVSIAEVITWNDYGESHYVGPIAGAQPMSESWTSGFDHTGWLDLMQYYIELYKTGSAPAITKDKILLWARLYPAAADAQDSVGKPNNWEWTQDFLWAVVLLQSPADVTLSCGSSSQDFLLPAGLSKVKLPLVSTCSVHSSVSRNNVVGLTFEPPAFTFRTDPPSYNFNAFVAASD